MELKVHAYRVLVIFSSPSQSKYICLFSYLLWMYTLHTLLQTNDKVLEVMCFQVMPAPKAQG